MSDDWLDGDDEAEARARRERDARRREERRRRIERGDTDVHAPNTDPGARAREAGAPRATPVPPPRPAAPAEAAPDAEPRTAGAGRAGALGERLRRAPAAVRRTVAAVAARAPRDRAGRRRLGVLALVALVLLVGAGVGLRALVAGGPPPQRAFDVLPSDALLALDVNVDRGRPAVDQLTDRLEDFPAFEAQRRQILRRLSPIGCDRPVRDIEGEEAALAIVGTTTGRSASLLAVDTGEERDAPQRVRCGQQLAAYVGRFLLVGPPLAVETAIARAAGEGRGLRPLSQEPAFRRLAAGLPEERAATAWASPDGVRRLLAPSGGLAGAAAGLLDRDDLRGVVASARATDEGARITVRSLGEGGGRVAAPTLLDDVPSGVLAAADVQGLEGSLPRLLGAFGQGDTLTALLPTLAERLEAVPGVSLRRDVQPLLDAEGAVVLTPGLPAPTISGIVRLPDGDASAASVGRVRRGLERVLRDTGGEGFTRSTIDGTTVWRVPLGTQANLVYAIDDDRLLLSTQPAGVRALLQRRGRLTDTAGWDAIGGDVENPVSSIGYLDFSQLLRLAQQTGIGLDPTYRTYADDLRRLRAVVLRARSEGGETTADLDLWIP